MTLGDILKQYREKHNISMDEFSKRSSLSKGYISMLENNINPRNNKPIAPTLPTIRKIALGMNTDTDILLKALDDNQEISLDSSDSDIYENFMVSPPVSDGDRLKTEDLDLLEQFHSLDGIGREHVLTVLDWELKRMQALEEPKRIVRQKKALEISEEDALYAKLSQEDLIALGNRPNPFQSQAFVSNGKDETPNSGEFPDSKESKLQPPDNSASKEDLATIKNGMEVLKSERSGKTGKNWSI